MLQDFGNVHIHNPGTITLYVKTLPRLSPVHDCTDYRKWSGNVSIGDGTYRLTYMLKQSRNGDQCFDFMK